MSEIKNEVLSLDNLDVKNLTELSGWEQKQNEIVAENPFIEITDNATWEQAKRHRTALVKARTTIEGQDKVIASKLASFRKSVKEESDKLIAITLPHEEKQQDEVKRYEAIKENERLERERLELERENGIKAEISRIESECYAVVQKMTFADIDVVIDFVSKATTTDYDFEEFDILFKQACERVVKALNEKQSDVMEKEAQRAENERLQRQSKRLAELMPYANYGMDVVIEHLYRFRDEEFNYILKNKKAAKDEHDRKAAELQAQMDNERAEREANECEEKEKVFDVRKNRIIELGYEFNPDFGFIHSDIPLRFSITSIFDADTIDFENYLLDIKDEISDFTTKKEEKEAEETREKEAALKAEKKNKARVKKLAGDKKIIEKFIDGISAPTSHPSLENDDLEFFLIELDTQLNDFKNQALENLKNL